jgi:Lipopolysaccharide-assembly
MRLRRWLLVGLVALAGSGCAGYKLGPVNGVAAREKSVQVNPFSNETLEPHLTDAVTQQLRKQLQLDGTYQLASHNDGNIVVSGSIIRYTRLPMSLASSDVLTVQDFRLDLIAQVSAYDRSSGKSILNRAVTGTTMMRVTSDLTSAERQALPLLAGDLAKHVTELLTEGGW